MPQFRILFYANYTILATQRGGRGPMPPLNTPLGADLSKNPDRQTRQANCTTGRIYRR